MSRDPGETKSGYACVWEYTVRPEAIAEFSLR